MTESILPGVLYPSETGWHMNYAVCDLALISGWRIDSIERVTLDLYRKGEHDVHVTNGTTVGEFIDELVIEAVGYLNAHVAGLHARFDFLDGEFIYQTNQWWEQTVPLLQEVG
jgi:hypothetical protein